MTYPRESTALLMIDPLNDFLADGGKLWPYGKAVAEKLGLHANLSRLLAAARAGGYSVVYVPHHRARPGDFARWKFMNPSHVGAQRVQPFALGTWGAEFHRDYTPQPDDVIAVEHWLHDGFASTDLAYQLQNRGIDRVVLAGMRGNTCVEATARHAVELGYHVTMVKDACGAFRWEEWVATMEVNALTFAHAILTTDEALAALGRGLPSAAA
jgi:nicotinamidase-related amidase